MDVAFVERPDQDPLVLECIGHGPVIGSRDRHAGDPHRRVTATMEEAHGGYAAAVPYCLDLLGAPQVETRPAIVAAYRPPGM